mgnify:CR=1 FL=1
MRAACYCRVSSQRQRDAHTIASQLRMLPEYIARQGWTLAAPADAYVDDGRTAKAGHLEKRHGLLRLLADAADRRFDVVVVVALDRLSRAEDMGERGQILGALQVAGVQLASLSGETCDLRTLAGEVSASLHLIVAAHANKARREATMRGKLEAIAQGRKPAGPTPWGLTYDRATHAWGLDAERAPIVREIYQRVAMGESCETIGRDLDDRGIARARGGSWTRERVWQIATQTTYRGEWRADKARGLVVPVPPVVDRDLWQAAQTALTSYGLRGLARTRHTYLCEGIAVCAVCGSRIAIASATGPSRGRRPRPAYYVCSHRLRPPRSGTRCDLPMRQVAEVDARVWARLAEVLVEPGYLERALARAESEAEEGRDWERDLAEWEGRLRRLERAESGILARYRRGLVSERAMDAELGAAGREREALERQVEAARRQSAGAARRRADAAGVASRLAELRARVPGASQATRRALLVALVPGLGEAVVRLGAWTVEAGLIVGEADGMSASAHARDQASVAGCRSERRIDKVLRVVA